MVNFSNDVSQNIIKLRKHYNLTQADLGKIVGKSDKAVSAWENGTRSPHIKSIKAIAKYFGISPTELSGDAFNDIKPMELTDAEKAHIMHLRSMDEKIPGLRK